MIPKLRTKKKIEENSKKNRILMTVFVIALLGISTAGYAFMEASSIPKQKYNGFTFTKVENGWQLKDAGITTRYLPQDVENISFSGNPSIDYFKGNSYVVAVSTEEKLAAVELLNRLPLRKANPACLPKYETEEFCSDLPIKSCEDADRENAVIIFEESDENYASYSAGCIYIRGSGEFMLRAADKALFMLYGVM